MKSCQHVGCRTSRTALEEPNQRHGGLLRTRRERPCRHTANKRDELAPPHLFAPTRKRHIVAGQSGKVVRLPLGDVRFGSKADIGAVRAMSALPPKADIAERRRDVRFVPKADIRGSSSLLL